MLDAGTGFPPFLSTNAKGKFHFSKMDLHFTYQVKLQFFPNIWNNLTVRPFRPTTWSLWKKLLMYVCKYFQSYTRQLLQKAP